ncbi:hypothetical protein MTR72_15710 [Bradyrhizobium sp. ISRA442]|uniref:hypothetical protein n=1 Tax=Bradyrhizobium sp. ISRA442 TaxID=2866197 RepID=UPI00311B04D8
MIGQEYWNQDGLILEDVELAADRALQLGAELSIVRPELKANGCAVRVMSAANTEVYRAPLDPISLWMKHQQ